eukprot:234356-Pleurochrysis_carterae.AAC.2
MRRERRKLARMYSCARYVKTSRTTRLFATLLACPSACLPAYPPARLPACPPARLLACLPPACLTACLYATDLAAHVLACLDPCECAGFGIRLLTGCALARTT